MTGDLHHLSTFGRAEFGAGANFPRASHLTAPDPLATRRPRILTEFRSAKRCCSNCIRRNWILAPYKERIDGRPGGSGGRPARRASQHQHGADCEHCGCRIGQGDLAELINHYLTQHGYRLLHTGTETSDDLDGRPWHSTVAVPGK